MTSLLVHLALVVTLQSPDGQGPSMPPAAQPAPQEAPPPSTTTNDDEERRRQAATQNPEAPQATPSTGIPVAAPQSQPADEPASPLVAGREGKESRDHFSGIFVSAVGGVVMLVGLVLGTVAAALSFVDAIPFPGGRVERTGFATSAIVGAVFCGLIGAALVAVGAALVGVSFL